MRKAVAAKGGNEVKLRLPFRRTLYVRLLKTQWTDGVRSCIESAPGMHILMVDADRCTKGMFLYAMKCAQRAYGLDDIHVFGTGKGFHAYECAQHTRGEVLDIHEYIGGIIDMEPRYDWASVRRGYWVLRFGEKEGSVRPHYLCVLRAVNSCGRPQSESHLRYLTLLKGGLAQQGRNTSGLRLPVITYEAEIK